MWSIASAAIVLAALVSASVSDVRTRHVDDRHWVLMCALCIPLMAFRLSDIAGIGIASMYAVGSALLSAYMLSERLVGWKAVPFVTGSAVMLIGPAIIGMPYGAPVAAIPVMFLLLFVSNRVGLIPGGADVKCLMSLAIVFPIHPDIPTVWCPVDPILNPVVTILPTSLILILVGVPVMLARNLRAGYIGRGMASTYAVEVSAMDSTREWPVAWVEDGVPIRRNVRDGPGISAEELTDRGVTEVRVTPAVPFILPVTVAYVLMLTLGLILRCRCAGHSGSNVSR